MLRSSTACRLSVAAAGNLLEWYDFAVFGLFSVEIGAAFFPQAEGKLPQIFALVLFAGAFVVRPLGGSLFGYLSDRRGRSAALFLTILGMAVPTLGIAALPGYDMLGVAAPLCLAALRLLQGVAAGGEVPGALVYAVESAPPGRKGLFGSLVQATGVGSVVANAVAAILHLCIGDAALRAWGWRLPFALGGVASLLVCCLRRSFSDSAEWAAAREAGALVRNPLLDGLRQSWRAVLLIAAAQAYGMTGFYLFAVWTPSYLREERGFEFAFASTSILTLLWAGAVACGGWLGDALGGVDLPKDTNGLRTHLRLCRRCSGGAADSQRRCCPSASIGPPAPLLTALLPPTASRTCEEPALCTGFGRVSGSFAALALALGPLAFMLLRSAPLVLCLGMQAALVVIHALYAGPLQAWIVLRVEVIGTRASCLGLAYNVSAATFAGTAPLIATSLSMTQVGPLAVGLYLASTAALSITALACGESVRPRLHAAGQAQTAMCRVQDQAQLQGQGTAILPPKELRSEDMQSQHPL